MAITKSTHLLGDNRRVKLFFRERSTNRSGHPNILKKSAMARRRITAGDETASDWWWNETTTTKRQDKGNTKRQIAQHNLKNGAKDVHSLTLPFHGAQC